MKEEKSMPWMIDVRTAAHVFRVGGIWDQGLHAGTTASKSAVTVR
jgi:hypothetical protein